jgi:hypothetical protein
MQNQEEIKTITPQNLQQQQQTKNSELQLQLPSDSNILSNCIKNLFIGLNKANKNGAFEIQESHQLLLDLNTLGNIVEQINKKVYANK